MPYGHAGLRSNSMLNMHLALEERPLRAFPFFVPTETVDLPLAEDMPGFQT